MIMRTTGSSRRSIYFRWVILGVFFLLTSMSATSCRPNTYKWSQQYQTKELLAFCGISAADGNNAWAVGFSRSSDGEIYYFDGHSWSIQYQTEDWLEGVSAADHDNVWAVGVNNVNNTCDGGVIYFFDGLRWLKQYETDDPYGIGKVFALSKSAVWAVGSSGKMYYFNGNTWEEKPTGGIDIRNIYALDSTHVWGASENAVFFYDGNIWSKQLDAEETNIWGIDAIDQSHVWAVGTVPDTERGKVYFFDGSSWVEQFSTECKLHGISIDGLGRAWVMGTKYPANYGIPIGSIFFFNGSNWEKQHEVKEALTGISTLGGGDVWVVGTYGGIYFGTEVQR